MKALMEQRLSDLKQLSYDELLRLSDYSGDKKHINGKIYSIGTWKSTAEDGRIEIVVQVYRPWFLGIGKMSAQGIRVDKDGAVEILSREDLYDFM